MKSALALLGASLLLASATATAGGTAFSIGDATVVEGSGNLQFTVTASPPPAASTQVSFATSNGTAQSGSDYAATSGVLTFGTGVATQVVTLSVGSDIVVEADETLNVTLSNPTGGATLADALGIGTIQNDDQTTVTLPASGVDEGDAGSVPMAFALSLSNPVQGVVNIAFQTADGNNANATLNATTADNDYVAASGTVGFPSLTVGPQPINVSVTGDTKVEPDQSFRLSVAIGSLPAGIDPADVILPAAPALGTIRNDDGAVVNVGDIAVNEGNGAGVTLDFPVTLSNVSKTPITVNYAATAGTAGAADFTAVSGTLVIPAFAPSATIPVPVLGELLVEPNETVTLTLSNPVGGFLGDSVGIGTITNDDSAVVSAANASLAEGNSGTSSMAFAVTLSNPVQGTVSVSAASADGANANPLLNATLADNDYQALSATTLGFAQGTTSQAVNVSIAGDTDVEPDQQLRLLLSNLTVPAGLPAGSVTLSPTATTGTIVNDDGTVLSIADASVVEGTGANSTLSFTVSLSAQSKAPVTVGYTATGQTATVGADFTAASGTLTIPSNTSSATLAVAVVGDNLVEGPETLQITLSNPQGATIGDGDAIGTITDDDVALLRIADASANEQGGGTLALNVTLSNPVAQTVTVNYASSNGSATAGSDYTAVSGQLTFTAGATSATIGIPLINDANIEGNETFFVTLSNPNPGAPFVVLDRPVGNGTIIDDEAVSSVPVGTPLGWLALAAVIVLFAMRRGKLIAIHHRRR